MLDSLIAHAGFSSLYGIMLRYPYDFIFWQTVVSLKEKYYCMIDEQIIIYIAQ